jgi:hypothetical protein
MFNGIEVITNNKIYDLIVSASFKIFVYILNITVYSTIVSQLTAKYHEFLIILVKRNLLNGEIT